MRESCKVDGTSVSARWPPAPCTAATSRKAPVSNSIFVSSSTKSGTPSVFATTRFTARGGRSRASASARTIDSTSASSSQFTPTSVTYDRFDHGGANVFRKVKTDIIETLGRCSISKPSNSSVDGSAQCRSSQMASTGCSAALSQSHSTSDSRVRRFRSAGLPMRLGYFSPTGSDSRFAISETTSGPQDW